MFASSRVSLCTVADHEPQTAFKCKIARDTDEGKVKLSRGTLFLTPSFVCFLPSKSPEKKVRKRSPSSHLHPHLWRQSQTLPGHARGA